MNQDLIKYLPGLEEDLPEAFEKLAEIFQHQVFELCADGTKEGSPDFYIPYMMNDAVESYLVLKKCRLVGEYDEGGCSEVSGELIREEGKFALIVRQDGGNVFTLWFDTLEFVREYYQYHQIGHFWMKGQEQWRQMVYIVGTIYDKMEYLGKESCNRQEKEILPLIGFAPFRRWSPISDSLEDVYPPTPEGTECMKRLAAEAGDNGYVRMIKIYEKLPFRWMEKILARRLCSPKRESLYRLICDKTAKASGQYQERHYEDCLG